MARPATFAILPVFVMSILAGGCACSQCEGDSGRAALSPDRTPTAERQPMTEPREASSPVSQQISLQGSWRISSLPGADLSRVSEVPTLAIDQDGEASGTSGVNTFNATVETDASGAIRFADLIYTEMAGSPEAMAVEGVFFRALAAADGAAVRDGRLKLTADGETVAVFEAASGD